MCFPGYKKKWGVSEGMHIRSFNLKIFLFKKNFGLCIFSNSSLFYVDKNYSNMHADFYMQNFTRNTFIANIACNCRYRRAFTKKSEKKLINQLNLKKISQ